MAQERDTKTSHQHRRSQLEAVLVCLSLTVQPFADDASHADERPQRPVCLYERTVEGKAICIRKEAFNADLCATIENFAIRHDVPPAFFARLIWRESLFKPEAISRKGAEGIAQFMPDTARRRGLNNSFDVVEALEASSKYLAELKNLFGNFGLSAAAYNAGETGLRRFLDDGRLPLETRDYVFAITGYPVEVWKNNPPALAAPDLEPNRPFKDACVTLAQTRGMTEPVLANSADWAPWGVQLAAHHNPDVAGRLFMNSVAKLPAPLNEERALIVRQRGGNFGRRPRYAARIGEETRAEATKLCEQITKVGVPCTVFRNR